MHETGQRTRRQFLRESIAAAAAAGVIAPTALGQAERAKRRTAWMIACRDAHLRSLGEPDTASAMAALGFDGVEVSVELNCNCPLVFGPAKTYSIATPDGVKALRDMLGAKKKRISAFCLHNAYDQRTDAEVELTIKTAKVAAEMGVPAIRLDIVPHKIKDQDEFLTFAVGIAKRILDGTKDLPVRFGVENHGGTTNKPEFLRKLFEGAGSKRFGLTLDTGNFYWFGHPLSKLYDIYAEFAPWACHTHCKSIHYPEADRERQRPVGWEYDKRCCPIHEGDIDFKRVAGILRKAGYAGDLCIEDESLGRFPKEQHAAILRKEAELLRSLQKA